MYAKKIPSLVILSFWMFLLLLLLARGVNAETTITIPAQLEVDSSVLYFKDVAHIETDNPEYAQTLGDLRIGKAPALGQAKKYRRSYFLTRLKQFRLDLNQLTLEIPPVVTIERRTSAIEIQKIGEAAKEAVLKAMNYQGQEVHIRLNSISGELLSPPGRLSFVPEVPLKKQMLGPQVIPVQVLVDDLPYKKVNVSMNVEVFASIWVAKHNLRRQQLITKEDLFQKRLKINDFPGEELITDSGKIVGQVTAVPIMKDKPLSVHKIKSPPLVVKGDSITIKAFSQNVSLLTPGQALENGREGEIIRVKNLNNRKMVMGRIINRKLVEVEVR